MIHQPIIDVKHRPYCGPTAISLLTGVPLSRIEEMLRRKRRGGYRDALGRKIAIKGTYTWEVVRVLKRLGCKVEELNLYTKTFGQFCRDTQHLASTFLVEVTGHFMVSQQGLIADNANQTPVPVEGYRRATRRVKKAWKITAPQLPLFVAGDALAAEQAPKPKVDLKVKRAQRLAAQIKKWETREKRTKTSLRKLRNRMKRYQKLGLAS